MQLTGKEKEEHEQMYQEEKRDIECEDGDMVVRLLAPRAHRVGGL